MVYCQGEGGEGGNMKALLALESPFAYVVESRELLPFFLAFYFLRPLAYRHLDLI
jgi:hypothetical protein